MGRKKIEIQRIEGERHRLVTYSKRKMGMIKKATELAVLTDAQVGLIAFGSNGKMTVYSSAPLEHIIERYRRHTEAPEVRSRARPHRTICTDCREKRGDPHTLLGYLSAHHFVARAQVFTNEHYFREKRKKEGIEQEGDDESDEAEEGADDPRLQAPAHVQYAAHQAPPPPLMPYAPPPHVPRVHPLPANLVHVHGLDGQPIPAHHGPPQPIPPGYMMPPYALPPLHPYVHAHHPPPPQPQPHQIIHAAPHAASHAAPHAPGGYAMHPAYPYYHPPPQDPVPPQPFSSPPPPLAAQQEIANPPPNILPNNPPRAEGSNHEATPVNPDGPDSPPQPIPHNRVRVPSPPPMPLENHENLSNVAPEYDLVNAVASAPKMPVPPAGVSADSVAAAAGQPQPASYPQYPQQQPQPALHPSLHPQYPQQPQPGPPQQQPGYQQYPFPSPYNVHPPPHHAAYPPPYAGSYHQVMQPGGMGSYVDPDPSASWQPASQPIQF